MTVALHNRTTEFVEITWRNAPLRIEYQWVGAVESAYPVVVSPHIFVEDITIKNIGAARETYLSTDLRAKIARYHDDPDSAFWGWNDIWLDPAFRVWNIEDQLALIACPTLAIQGEDDEYG